MASPLNPLAVFFFVESAVFVSCFLVVCTALHDIRGITSQALSKNHVHEFLGTSGKLAGLDTTIVGPKMEF